MMCQSKERAQVKAFTQIDGIVEILAYLKCKGPQQRERSPRY